MHATPATAASPPQFQFGMGWNPKTTQIDPFDSEPQINGRPVKWISEIRNAPGGAEWSFLGSRYKGSDLLVRVLAVATDQFTLYLEEGPLEERASRLNGGIHLDASGRNPEAKLTNYIIKFHLPFEKEIYIPNLKNPLLSANKCPLVQPPKNLPVALVEVTERQRKSGHQYSISNGWFKDGKIILFVEHFFPVIGFRFEYQSRIYTKNYRKILNTELFAIEDHNNSDCSCSRKGKITSVIGIELAKLNQDKPDEIVVWGTHDTQFLSAETEFGIPTDPQKQPF